MAARWEELGEEHPRTSSPTYWEMTESLWLPGNERVRRCVCGGGGMLETLHAQYLQSTASIIIMV